MDKYYKYEFYEEGKSIGTFKRQGARLWFEGELKRRREENKSYLFMAKALAAHCYPREEAEIGSRFSDGTKVRFTLKRRYEDE